jgi:DNA invertase Pin-like site-specific DNA recombinase
MSVPAAQYLRMSTEHQQYSLLNQAAGIRRYAEERGFLVVKTYSDPAKSGLGIRKRPGLRALLSDVVSKSAEFKVVLVYDVSRWGRFQDNDESAFYEFICKQAGIPVRYCAETFENDGTLPSMIIKALKRSMAGEYSRELSVKVYEGQKRVAQLGYKNGGLPGYGFRRMMVSRDGTHKHVLGPGECKSLATDRVTLVLGPPEEVECVREMFRLFTECRWSGPEIATELNRRGIKGINGHSWSYWDVYGILHRPKYTGWALYGRTAKKLCMPMVRIPPDQWTAIRSIEPIVDQATFDAAQLRFELKNPAKVDDERLLKPLRSLLAREGYLTTDLIKTTPDVFPYRAYRIRFGGLKRVYQLLGMAAGNRFRRTDSRARIQSIFDRLITTLAELPGIRSVTKGANRNARLRLKNGLIVSVLTCHCNLSTYNKQRWVIKPTMDERKHLTLLALLDERNEDIESFYLVPKLEAKIRNGTVSLGLNHALLKAGQKVEILNDLARVAKAIRGTRRDGRKAISSRAEGKRR